VTIKRDQTAKLPINVPKWRENAQNKLKELQNEVRGIAPPTFMEKLTEALHEATSSRVRAVHRLTGRKRK